MKRADVKRALAVAGRLQTNEQTAADLNWVAAWLEREANAMLQRRRAAHRPRNNDDLYLWMTFDKFLNDRTERELKLRWNYAGQRTARITLAWLPRVRRMYAQDPNPAQWRRVMEMQRKQRT